MNANFQCFFFKLDTLSLPPSVRSFYYIRIIILTKYLKLEDCLGWESVQKTE